ncbi:MAG: HNH endonuclease signature motif containing protein [Candidatus Electrothrix gigas]
MSTSKPLPVSRKDYDHPEHFWDRITEHCTSDRLIPAQLQDLLLEQAGHRCTICREPSYEFHHITELGKGGNTEYENLIVLCPNCHTRVHREGIPNKKQLRHYKLKEEVVYGLPILGKLTAEEGKFVQRIAVLPPEEIVFFIERHYDKIMVDDHEEAKRLLRKQIGLLYLEEEGIIRSEYESSIKCVEGGFHTALHIRITDKGIRWLKYLLKTEMVNLVSGKDDV